MKIDNPETLTPQQRKTIVSAGVAIIAELAIADCECWRYSLDDNDAALCWPCRMTNLARAARAAAGVRRV